MVHQVHKQFVRSKQEQESWILSVGIDIGTSTTKMILSRLKLTRTSSSLSLPRYGITERQLVYESPIYTTPLKSVDEIDADRIWEMLSRDYAQAGVAPSDLKSGAVIITGETANKKNARQIVHLLAARSGDFVVATAGADLEGLLAGKGAGADERSRQTREAVANIDVGGGTANTAVFSRGKPVGTVTYHVGGRLIQLDRDGTVTAVSPSIRPWLHASGYGVEPGRKVSFGFLKELCTVWCRELLHDLKRRTGRIGRDEFARASASELLLGEPPESLPVIEEWMFSGGIGRLMNEPPPASLAETAAYGDVGPLLAHTLKELASQDPDIRFGRPAQTVRATVIGAGMRSMEISGATVHLDASLLPIRNLPVLKAELTSLQLEEPERLAEALRQLFRYGAALYDPEASPPFALALTGLDHAKYQAVQHLAEALAQSYRECLPGSGVMVLLCANDMAKALGMALERRLGGSPKVICIDQVSVEQGDYVDLGEPISGMMIPVVVKTLAFDKRAG